MRGRIPEWTTAERLRKARREAGMTPEDMALRLHVSAATVRNYEAGRTHPTYPTVVLWSTICGVDETWLAGHETPEISVIRFLQPSLPFRRAA